MEDNNKKLSEEDIDKIVDALCTRITDQLYQNVGQGILRFVWKGALIAIIALAAYGSGVLR